MGFVTQENHQTALAISAVIEIITLGLQRFRVTLVELDNWGGPGREYRGIEKGKNRLSG